jgi:hypothetical protein
VVVGAATVAGLSALLWRGHARPLQELTTLAGATVAIAAVVAMVGADGAVGLTVWVAGAMLLAAGLRRALAFSLILRRSARSPASWER